MVYPLLLKLHQSVATPSDKVGANGEIIWKGDGEANWYFLENKSFEWIYEGIDYGGKHKFSSQLNNMNIIALAEQQDNNDFIIKEIKNKAGEIIPRSEKVALNFNSFNKNREISTMNFNANKIIKLERKS